LPKLRTTHAPFIEKQSVARFVIGKHDFYMKRTRERGGLGDTDFRLSRKTALRTMPDTSNKRWKNSRARRVRIHRHKLI
jgi:hypothetical protein